MNNSLDRLFSGIIASLHSEIIPRLDDEFARGQAYATIDLLNNLRPRLDWAVGPLAAQIAAQLVAARRIDELAQGVPNGPPALPPALAAMPDPAAGETLRWRRDQLDEHLCKVVDWQNQPPAGVSETALAAIAAVTAQYMQEQVRREVSLLPKPLFGEIAGNTGAAKASGKN